MLTYPKFSILILLFSSIFSSAQDPLFQRIEVGEIVNTPSGSRSCNYLDFNNDGMEDIMITNGTSGGEDNMLYLNLGNDDFELQIGEVGSDGSPSDGSTCADFNNDGSIDIYTVNWYNVPNLLYTNDGTGSFIEVDTGLVSTISNYSETASWGDADNDGLVDLYVTNSSGNRRNHLFRNIGNGYFEKLDDIIPTSDLDYSRNVTWTDYDLDGDLDLYVTNESNQENDLYQNQGDFEFTKILDSDLVADPLTTMSSSWADVDNDGDLDVFLANYQQDNQLFINDGNANFSSVEGPWDGSGGCSFSSNFADYDNDGDLDLFVTNGFCEEDLKNFLYENQGNSEFQEVLIEPMAIDSGSSYGCAWGDYNNDGYQDLVVANWQDETQNNYLYKNLGNGSRWIELRLEGVQSNRSAIGARVYCYAELDGENIAQMREVSAQTGYCGQNSLVVHFGLADAAIVDSIIIQWPSGIEQELVDLEVDQIVSVIESLDTGIDIYEERAVDLLIHPNPVDDLIEIPSDKILGIEIVDLQGKLVRYSNDNRVSTRDIKKGTYLVRLTLQGNTVREQKILISH